MRLEHLAVIGLASIAMNASTMADTVTYTLEDVWLDPDITHPWEQPRPMTGTFGWTYAPGDFENGMGDFVELDLPWWDEEGFPPLAWMIEQSQIEIVMPGKYHDLGVDVTLRLLDPLALDRSSDIDTVLSQFEIQVGVARQGHVISGRVTPEAVLICSADVDGDGSVAFGDLLAILAAWGACAECPEDLDQSGEVDFGDLLLVLGAWGPCP